MTRYELIDDLLSLCIGILGSVYSKVVKEFQKQFGFIRTIPDFRVYWLASLAPNCSRQTKNGVDFTRLKTWKKWES